MTGSAHQDHSKHENDVDPYDMDKSEKYAAVRAMTFTSEEVAYEFYNKYANDHGFSIRREKVKKATDDITGTPTFRYRRFLCSKAGTREAKYLNIRHKKKAASIGTDLSLAANVVPISVCR